MRDGRLSSEKYFEIFRRVMIHEKAEVVVITQFACMHSALVNFTPSEFMEDLSEVMRDFTRQFLAANINNASFKASIGRYLTVLSKSEASLRSIEDAISVGVTNKPLPLDLVDSISSPVEAAVLNSASLFRSREAKRKFFERFILSSKQLFSTSFATKC